MTSNAGFHRTPTQFVLAFLVSIVDTVFSRSARIPRRVATAGHIRPTRHQRQCPAPYSHRCHWSLSVDQHPVPDYPIAVAIGGDNVHAMPKRFSSGSTGWYVSTKLEMEGERVQVSLSMVIIGSKPKTEATVPQGEQGRQTGQEAPQVPQGPETNGTPKGTKGPVRRPKAV